MNVLSAIDNTVAYHSMSPGESNKFDGITRNLYMKIFINVMGLVVAAATVLTACGGGGGDPVTKTPTPVPTPIASSVNTAMYPAPDGVSLSKFIDLTLPQTGYIDVTTWISSVHLYSTSLVLIKENLTGSDVIQAGTYKVKISYGVTSNIPGNVTFYSTALTPYKALKDLKSARYDAVGSLGAYSDYYKLSVANDININISTYLANVYIFNVGLLGENVSLLDNYVQVLGTKYLARGEYIVKILYGATSNTPGSVTVYIP
ncbi:MAG: hypothetical protein WCQ41_09910 [Bacillota bacterium]